MQKKNIIITVAIVILVGASAFYGGMVYEKNNSSTQGLLRNASGGSRQLGQGQNGPGGQGRPGSAGFNRGAGGDFVAGEIISKDDKSLTVKSPDGSSKIIFFSDSTTIGKSTGGSPADLSSGQNVTISGKSNSDGTVTAQNIQIRPEL